LLARPALPRDAFARPARAVPFVPFFFDDVPFFFDELLPRLLGRRFAERTLAATFF